MFRPCIDLHEGRVKQIVGGTLGDAGLRTNFVSDRSPAWFAELYRRDNLTGGHVIMLGPDNDDAARTALAAFTRTTRRHGSRQVHRTSSSPAGFSAKAGSMPTGSPPWSRPLAKIGWFSI